MRDGELRALRWDKVIIDSDLPIIQVRHGAGRAGDRSLGPTKSKAGIRDIPMMEMLVNTLREWRKVCPREGMLSGFNTSEAKVLEIARLIEAHPVPRIAVHSKRVRPGISARAIAKQVGVHHTTVIRVRAAMPITSNSLLGFVFPSKVGTMITPGSIYRYLQGCRRRSG